VIHSHKRPASYYLHRSYVENKVLSSLLDYHSFDFKKIKINSFQDFTNHAFSLYSSLNSCVDLLEKQRLNKIPKIFEFLKKELPVHLSSNQQSKNFDSSLDDLFAKFPRAQGIKNSFLLLDYQHSLNNFQLFLQKTYPNISGIEKDFIDTLYKLFSTIVGGRLAGLEKNMIQRKIKDDDLEKIVSFLSGGV